MNKVWGHFKTITKHRHQVIYHCYKAGIFWQGCKHDLSKYYPTEFFVGVKYYTGDRSPNEGEREAYGYSKSWMHHKGRNKHHFEYWTDYNPATREIEPIKMPTNYVIEMFCDRIAASKIYLGKRYTHQEPIAYFMKGKRNRMIHPETSELIEALLVMLAEKGEEATFKYIRGLNKKT